MSTDSILDEFDTDLPSELTGSPKDRARGRKMKAIITDARRDVPRWKNQLFSYRSHKSRSKDA
jgi:hypothetical protein